MEKRAILPILVTLNAFICPDVVCAGSTSIDLSVGPQVSPPHDNLARDDYDLDDDDPLSLPVLTPGALYLPLPSTGMGVTGVTYTFPWPFLYLARHQLLTRS